MSYDAKVFNVMIASPSDVPEERQIVSDVIHEWNAVNSEQRNIVLMPVKWETHSSPEMGDHPQNIINKRILDRCDLLVGLFGTRVGTATENYSSGTVEEIEKHIDSSKPAMLYFSEKMVHPKEVVSEQYQKLQEFKESCRSRGLYENYNSIDEFRDKFNKHLQIKVNEHEIFKANSDSAEPLGDNNQSEVSSLTLSNDAKSILKIIVDNDGSFHWISFDGGRTPNIRVTPRTQSNDKREHAKIDSLLDELVKFGYMTASSNNQHFDVTHFGYEFID